MKYPACGTTSINDNNNIFSCSNNSDLGNKEDISSRNISNLYDQTDHQSMSTSSQTMQYYQQVGKNSNTGECHHQQRHKSPQNLYSTTNYQLTSTSCQICGQQGQSCKCSNRVDDKLTPVDSIDNNVTYGVVAREAKPLLETSLSSSASSSSSVSSSSSAVSSNSVVRQENQQQIYNCDDFQQQNHSNCSSQLQHQKQASSQPDHHRTAQISDADGQQQLLDNQYNYDYKVHDGRTNNWSDIVIEGGQQLRSNLECPSTHQLDGQVAHMDPASNQQTYNNHGQSIPSQACYHKTVISGIDLQQDYNNNQESSHNYHQQTDNLESSIFDQSMINQVHTNDYANNYHEQDQLYSSATYFTQHSSSTNCDSVSIHYQNGHSNEQFSNASQVVNNIQQDSNLEHQLNEEQGKVVVKHSSPPFETLAESNQPPSSIQLEYSSRPPNYGDQYHILAPDESLPVNSYSQPALNKLEIGETTNFQQNDRHIQHHEQEVQWLEEPNSHRQQVLSNKQECNSGSNQAQLLQQHTFIDNGQHLKLEQYAPEQQQTQMQLPYDSLQQLAMDCDSYSNQVSTCTSSSNLVSQSEDNTKACGSKSRRGRPRKKGLRSKNKVNGKLWEFIRDLLLNERTNPTFIRWERREDGVFKFVQSDKVAKMWGERKQNPKMTYEKLSRAMRYYYKSKVLLPVFGRRLVYKFGPNATGWLPNSANIIQ